MVITLIPVVLSIPPSLPLVFVLSYPPSFNQPPYFQCPAVTAVSRELPRDRGSRKTHLSPSYPHRIPTAFKYPCDILQAIHSLNNEQPKKLELDDINRAIKCRFHQSRVLSEPTQQFYAYQSMQDPPTLLVGVRTPFSVTSPQVVTILRP